MPKASDLVAVLPAVQTFLKRQHSAFIAGRAHVGSHASALMPVYNPADGSLLANVAESDANLVDTAVQDAHAAFHDKRWSGLRPADRERVLFRFADVIEKHTEELAQLETLEQGKSIHISRGIEVGATVEYVRYMAGLATKSIGQTLNLSIPIPPGAKYFAYTKREPLGVVAGIAPWNFPLMIGLWKVAPALAAGNSIILKPSEFTPLTALRVAELAIEAGIPPGAFNVVTGSGRVTGSALVSNPRVAKISFTGSTATGRSIGKQALDHMTRLSLELGGKNPAIFLDDIDMASAIPGAMMAAFLNQGQVCAAASRFYVEAPIFDRFVDALSGAIGSMRLGAGLDPQATLNPVVSKPHQTKIQSYIEDAKKQGATIIKGAAVPDSKGYYVEPTILLSPESSVRACTEEVFGPVLSIFKVANLQEAITQANATDYGLTASVWTRDLARTLQATEQLQAGTVWVNTHNPVDPNMPFGGYKQSGMGRDFGTQALDAYTELKSVCIAH
jgi:phenylacetaldehyde dehydrogenase